ncbi:MAG TPA: type IV pilus assembly protein PilM [Actinobacteria bacterium]|nr:type IV pilus assembly protein PilM [Actinomycetota bacterium]
MAVTVGVDIGGTAVRAAAVDAVRGRWILRRWGEMPLPRGAVVAGEIVDEGAVVEALGALWKRHKLPKRGVVLGTASQRLVVRQVDVPQMEPSELAEALPYQVQDSIPIAIDDAVLDYVPLESFTTPEGEPMLSILVVAVHRDTVETILRVVDRVGIRTQALDLQAFALLRATFGVEPAVDNPVRVVVDIGATLTQVVVARGGVAEFVRLLPTGGDAFTEALMDRLGWPRTVAEERKREIGVLPDGTPEPSLEEEGKALSALTAVADELIDEIVGSIRFHLSQREGPGLEAALVAGNGARLPHLANRLGIALDVPVRPAKVLDHVEVGRVQLTEEELLDAQAVLPVAVGLGLWGMT